MREIKFRAKDKYSNDWVYGSLVANISEPQVVDDSGYKTTIDVRTIGEYTGVQDKNGKEIYEGDIIAFWEFNNDDPYASTPTLEKHEEEVEFGGAQFHANSIPLVCFGKDCWPESSPKELLIMLGLESEDSFKEYYKFDIKDVFGCEVIGNIYDNP